MSRSLCTLILTVSLLVCSGCGSGESGDENPVDSPSSPTAESASASTSDGQASGATDGSASDVEGGMRTFVVVPGESTASYIVQEEFFAGALSKLGINAGKAQVTGSTGEVAGQLQLDLGSDDPLGENWFTVGVNTFVTNQDRRDKWIKEDGPTFNNFPTAEFVAHGIEGAPTSYTEGEEVEFELSGDLTIRDVTNPATFSVTAKLQGDTINGIAIMPSKLTDWGIEPPNFANTLTVADDFEIRLEFTARE